MRLVMLALFCAVLVAAAVRARMLLARAIAEGTRRANLTRYLPTQIIEGLSTISTETLTRGRKQAGAVLFVDIRGFTARAETMDPAELGGFLSAFRRIVREAVERHGGIVDKHIGDAVMVVFGVPRPSGGDARNALAGARDILAGMAKWNAARAKDGEDAVAIGIGLHWGDMFVGGIGDEQRLEVTVLGDTVNIAARLQETSKHAGCALVVSTRRAGRRRRRPVAKRLDRPAAAGPARPPAGDGDVRVGVSQLTSTAPACSARTARSRRRARSGRRACTRGRS